MGNDTTMNSANENQPMRVEKDSMGEIQVPQNAYYGAQTQRAVENFPISGWEMPAADRHKGPETTAVRGRPK